MKRAKRLTTVVGCAAVAMAALGAAPGATRAKTLGKPVATKAAGAPAQVRIAPKGLSTGISVHGHWVIEVKNPDGKVTARREFENSIQPSGEIFLASLLAGNNSPGGISILLNGASATLCPGFGCPLPSNGNGNALIYSPEAGPCMPLSNIADSPLYVTYGNSGGGSVCLITSSVSWLGIIAAGDMSELPTTLTPPVSLNLGVSAPTFPTTVSSASIQMTLSGNVPATSSAAGSVNDVETIFTTCTAGSTAAGCTNYSTGQTQSPTPVVVALNLFTQKNLDSQGTDPAPVPYTPGQTIAVTVTFTFQ